MAKMGMVPVLDSTGPRTIRYGYENHPHSRRVVSLGLGAAAAIALAAMWAGLIASYLWSSLPPSFSIMFAVAVAYGLAVVVPAAARPRRGRRSALPYP